MSWWGCAYVICVWRSWWVSSALQSPSPRGTWNGLGLVDSHICVLVCWEPATLFLCVCVCVCHCGDKHLFTQLHYGDLPPILESKRWPAQSKTLHFRVKSLRVGLGWGSGYGYCKYPKHECKSMQCHSKWQKHVWACVCVCLCAPPLSSPVATLSSLCHGVWEALSSSASRRPSVYCSSGSSCTYQTDRHQHTGTQTFSCNIFITYYFNVVFYVCPCFAHLL